MLSNTSGLDVEVDSMPHAAQNYNSQVFQCYDVQECLKVINQLDEFKFLYIGHKIHTLVYFCLADHFNNFFAPFVLYYRTYYLFYHVAYSLHYHERAKCQDPFNTNIASYFTLSVLKSLHCICKLNYQYFKIADVNMKIIIIFKQLLQSM